MQAVITGDIINSRSVDISQWLPSLREALTHFGEEGKDWEIYRGDSFQLLTSAEKGLFSSFVIKSKLKQIAAIDVRMSIGLGDVNYRAKQVTASNGSAFIYSGSAFELLKKRTLALQSAAEELNRTLNLLIDLYLLQANNWTAKAAEVVYFSLLNSDLNQQEIAEKLHVASQSSISKAYKRAAYEELKDLLAYYQYSIQAL